MKKGFVKLILLLMVGLIFGYAGARFFHSENDERIAVESTQISKQDTIWTCSMHPQIRLPKPGQCPICGMDLIALKSDNQTRSERSKELVLSEYAAKLADIEVQPVQRKFVDVKVRMVGKVDYDESRISYITAWTSGRIDRLFIDQTGVPVRKGEHTAYLYSPELLSSQEEYLQALAGLKSVKETELTTIKSSSENMVQNAREKLKLLGVTEAQIAELEDRKKPSDHMTIYSPTSGIVVRREVGEGDYIKTGARIYAIVDLSHVWIKLDAYEKDLQWLRYGQEVVFEAEAYPGEFFQGRISFIEPILDQVTRTVKIRVNIDNKDGWLKPGMFVRASVHARIAGTGKVMDDFLEGKWICSMHPEVIENNPGNCPVCTMPLVRAESMGYISEKDAEAPLVVPASAVLKTGKRSVVYVKIPSVSGPTFEGREVVLAARAGDYYLVKEGLAQGEMVVSRGNFKIDSALQIQAKPSMMNPPQIENHDENHKRFMEVLQDNDAGSNVSLLQPRSSMGFLEQLNSVYSAYFELQEMLARDNLEGAKLALQLLRESIDVVNMQSLEGKSHEDWMGLEQNIKNAIAFGNQVQDIEELRDKVFTHVSTAILLLEEKFGHVKPGSFFEIFCPMVHDNAGASWLQKERSVMNPFFGKAMQNCGTLKKEYPSRSFKDRSEMKQTKHDDSGAH